jgi:hypothetical protein
MSYEHFNFRRIESSTCQHFELTNSQFEIELAKVLKIIGAQSCNIINDKTTVFSCDQINMMVNKYIQTVQNVACILDSSSNLTTTYVKGIKSIKFVAKPIKDDVDSGKTDINCPLTFGIKDPDMIFQMISKIELSDDEIIQIASECNSFINMVVEIVQQSIADINKQHVLDTLYNLNTISQKTLVRNILKEIDTTADDTGIVTVVGKNIKISGRNCHIKPTMLFDIIAEQVVFTTVTSGLVKINQTVVEAESKLKLLKGSEMIVVTKPISKWVYIGIAGGVVLLIVIILFLKKRKESSIVSDTDVDKFLSKIGPSQYIKF